MMNANVQQSSYYDTQGNLLWTEPMMMSRLDGVGDVLVHDRVAYRVQRVAVAGCVQIVNLRRMNQAEVTSYQKSYRRP